MRFVDYLLSGLVLFAFGLFLLIFHPIQLIAFRVLGPRAHKHSVDILNFLLTNTLLLQGTRKQFRFLEKPPMDRPLVFVANHQSMHDIPGLIWHLRRYSPLFVSKIELAKGIPSISYNLQKSGAALINRKDGRQAMTEIARLGTLIQEKTYSAIIFPEGTRSRTGQLKDFQPGGLATLLKKAPDAWVVPIVIEGLSRMNPKGNYPLRAGCRISWTVLPSFDPRKIPPLEVTKHVENMIRDYRRQQWGYSD